MKSVLEEKMTGLYKTIFFIFLFINFAFSGAALAIPPYPPDRVPIHPMRVPGFIPPSMHNPGEGITNHQIYSAESKDGLTWQQNGKLLFAAASVPDAVLKDGKIYLYFMDASEKKHRMSVAISQDLGASWQKQDVAIQNRQTTGDAVDPNPILLDNGTIRLFYLGTFGPPDPNSLQDHTICSALSTDGIHFVEEKGFRFSDKKSITDPDTVKTDKGWKMFVSQGRENWTLTSTDGMTFTREAQNASEQGSVSRTIKFADGYRMYYCGEGSIRSQFTTDFSTWRQEGIRLMESGKVTCDPGLIQLPNGSYKMFYKTLKPRGATPFGQQ